MTSQQGNNMTSQQALEKLQAIKSKGLRILRLLEIDTKESTLLAEIRDLTSQFRHEIELEYDRTLPERVQKNMTIFEVSVYSPAIEEIWIDTGIRKLKTDGSINGKWAEAVEAVLYKVSKYLP
jgi:hypothetical protein